jgi:glycosyltransferase involved in cell wall biosynthesis
MISHLNNMRLMVLPSAGEGMPNTILEAMACETPVLATPVGGISELIQHQVTGYLLKDRSPETIAKAIVEALADEGLPMVARRAHEYVEQNYSLEASTRRWRSVLEDLAH